MSVKVLTVDDCKTIRFIVTKAFKPYDCVVLEADNGVVGLAMAGREKPDIILLDYSMPVMDGFEVLARLRSDPELKATPVIMLTAEASRETVIKIAKLGVRDYLIKPFKGEMLVERVGRVIPLKAVSDLATGQPKRFDDPIRVLVVDDKPAIAGQIQAALAGTAWVVSSADQPGKALEVCVEQGADIVLINLSLPNDGAVMLYHNLRSHIKTAAIPILGLSVKTALNEQAAAQQTGFNGIVTKPIDAAELKGKISRTLKLETSYKYFKQSEAALVLMMPKEFHQGIAREVSTRLEGQLAATVDAGGDKFIIDLSALETTSLPLIELVFSAIQAGNKLSLKHAVVAPATTKAQCQSYEETQSWCFAENFDLGLSMLK